MEKFGLQVGQLQRLQQSATFFAAMVTKFCGPLLIIMLKALIVKVS